MILVSQVYALTYRRDTYFHVQAKTDRTRSNQIKYIRIETYLYYLIVSPTDYEKMLFT